MVYQRTCTRCGKRLPETAEFFHRRPGGFTSQCRACRNEQQRVRDRRAGNPELKAAYMRARHRALARLARMYPVEFKQLLRMEYEKEKRDVVSP